MFFCMGSEYIYIFVLKKTVEPTNKKGEKANYSFQLTSGAFKFNPFSCQKTEQDLRGSCLKSLFCEK